jgi:hypothetical protein
MVDIKLIELPQLQMLDREVALPQRREGDVGHNLEPDLLIDRAGKESARAGQVDNRPLDEPGRRPPDM